MLHHGLQVLPAIALSQTKIFINFESRTGEWGDLFAFIAIKDFVLFQPEDEYDNQKFVIQ